MEQIKELDLTTTVGKDDVEMLYHSLRLAQEAGVLFSEEQKQVVITNSEKLAMLVQEVVLENMKEYEESDKNKERLFTQLAHFVGMTEALRVSDLIVNLNKGED